MLEQLFRAFKISNKGYFNESGVRGDLIAKAKILVPKNLSQEEKDLYKKLQKITSFMPRNN